MQISAEEGTFLGLLVAAIGARRVVEVGTLRRATARCAWPARCRPAGSSCAATYPRNTPRSRGASGRRPGSRTRIELRLGPAVETLRSLPPEPLDFAFIDADKENYRAYYEALLARLRPGGVIAIDNVLWSGQVIRADDQSENTRAIRALNDHVAGDRRVQSVMLGLSDGVTLVRKL